MLFAKIHPLIVHFPVGLLISGVLFEIFGRLQKEESVTLAGYFNIRLGLVFALLAMTVGILGVMSLEVKENFKGTLSSHILFAFSTVGMFGLSLLAYRFRSRRWVFVLYHGLIVAGLFGALATGYFGGELVYRFGVSTLQPVE